MANESSFFGNLTFRTDKDSWSPEGYLLAYEVLGSIDSTYGDYGVELNDSETSADFLAQLLDQKRDGASIDYVGRGRWSANNTLESFPEWSKYENPRKEENINNYLKIRKRLIDLMYKHEWYFVFDYIDEECGANFIEEGAAVITTKYCEIEKEIILVTYSTTFKSVDRTLYNYSLMIDKNRYGDAYDQTLDNLLALLKINKSHEALFAKYLINGAWDKEIPVDCEFDSVSDLPEGFVSGWKKYLMHA